MKVFIFFLAFGFCSFLDSLKKVKSGEFCDNKGNYSKVLWDSTYLLYSVLGYRFKSDKCLGFNGNKKPINPAEYKFKFETSNDPTQNYIEKYIQGIDLDRFKFQRSVIKIGPKVGIISKRNRKK